MKPRVRVVPIARLVLDDKNANKSTRRGREMLGDSLRTFGAGPDSSYHAQVEEYWVSPTKWKRTIESPHFSQTLVVNGDAVSEQGHGRLLPLLAQRTHHRCG